MALYEEGDLDTEDTHLENTMGKQRDWHDVPLSQHQGLMAGTPAARGVGHGTDSPSEPRKEPTRGHCDLRLPVSRAVREYLSWV